MVKIISVVNSVHPGELFTRMAEAVGIKSQEDMSSHHEGTAALKPYAGESMDNANANLYLASDESIKE